MQPWWAAWWSGGAVGGLVVGAAVVGGTVGGAVVGAVVGAAVVGAAVAGEAEVPPHGPSSVHGPPELPGVLPSVHYCAVQSWPLYEAMFPPV